MATQVGGRGGEARPRGRARWWSTERGQAGLLAAAVALLEICAIESWLLVFAAFYAGATSRAPLPLWLLACAYAAFALVTGGLRYRPIPLLAICVTLVGAAALMVAIRVSPSAYGDVPGGLFDAAWLQALVADVESGASRASVLFGLAVLVAFVGWRGVALGSETPAPEGVLTRLKVFIGAIVLAAAAAAAARGAARDALIGALAVLVPLAVFAGLLAAALARAAVNRAERRRTDPGMEGGERWLAMALALALLVVGGALLLSVVISYDGVSAALRQLGPVGAALDEALIWLTHGVALLLGLLLDGPIEALRRLLGSATPTPPAVTPQTTPGRPPEGLPPAAPSIWLLVAQIMLAGLVLLALVATALTLVRLAQRRERPDEEPGIDEERESLDGRALLRAQLRDLLRGRRRAASSAEEVLPAASVRALYREVLRAAAARGLGRLPAETPDEHARRLAGALGPPATSGDAATVAEAYDAARYGEREPRAEEQRALRERAEHVRAALRHRERA